MKVKMGSFIQKYRLFLKPLHAILCLCVTLNGMVHADANCLKDNPGVLHGRFDNDREPKDISVQKLMNEITIFGTRFNTGHILNWDYNNETIKSLIEELAVIPNITTKFYFNLDRIQVGSHRFATDQRNKFSSASQSIFEASYRAVLNVSKPIQMLANGFYLHLSHFPIFNEQRLSALENVVGPLENSSVSLGAFIDDCINGNIFENPTLRNTLKKLKFITCKVEPTLSLCAHKSAADVITICNQIVSKAKLYEIEAQIMCMVSYPSNVNSFILPFSGDAYFKLFWCKVVELGKETQIIINSAFDVQSDGWRWREVYETTGWWTRIQTSRNKNTTYVEKVEDISEPSSLANETKLCTDISERLHRAYKSFKLSNQSFARLSENGFAKYK